MSKAEAGTPKQPYWLRRNISLIRGRNAADEGCYAEILCNYQILCADLKTAQRGGTPAIGNAKVTDSRSPSVAVFNGLGSVNTTAGADLTGINDPHAGRMAEAGESLRNATAYSSSTAAHNMLGRAVSASATATSNNFSYTAASTPHSDVHATIRELSNELDRARNDVQEKNNTISSMKATCGRLESQVGELTSKLANVSLSVLKLEADGKKREDMINLLKNEREGFMSENDTLRKKASDASREASKFRNDLMSWKEVEIGLRQQVFELESLVAAIRRGEADTHMQGMEQLDDFLVKNGNGGNSQNASGSASAAGRSSSGGGANSDFVDVGVPSSAECSPTTENQAEQNSTRARFNSFIDSFLGYGKPFNSATNNAAMQHQQLQQQQHQQAEAPTFTAQTAAFTGTDISRGHTAAASIPTFASFVVEKAHDGDLQALCFTENSRHLWTGGAEKAIKCWDVNANGRMVVRLPCANGFPMSLHSVGDLLAVGCSDATIRVFETSRFRDKCQLTGHSEKVTSAVLSPDCLRVLSTATDRTIKKWAVNREQLESTIMCVSGCNDIALMNGKLASGHHDGTVRIWDTRDCKESGEVKNVHEKAIACVRWVGEGLLVASMGRDDMIRVSDIRTMRTLHTIRDPALRVASNQQRFDISADGRYLCVGSSNGNLLFFNTDSAALASPTNSSPKVITAAHAGYIMNVTWNPEGKGLATVGSDKKLAYWR